MLPGESEPCTIDDTPQFPETTGTTIGYKNRAATIRANPAQTASLKRAYEQSNVISAEQAKILAEGTGLAPKWILQWFSRQRSKDRKNDVHYRTGLKFSTSATGSKQASNPATFSAAFFSDSSSGALATGNVSAQEIMTIKSEYQDIGSLASTPSVSSSMSLEVFQTPLSVSGSSSMSTSVSGHLDMVAHEDTVLKISRTGRKKDPAGRKNRNTHTGRKVKHTSDSNAQTKSTGGAGFRLLKLEPLEDTTYGLNFSDGQTGKTETDMDAYTQLSSPLSAPQIHLPHIVPPRRSPIVPPDKVVRSGGREIKTRHTPSRLSVVDVAIGESDTSLFQENSFSIPTSTVNSAAGTFSHKNLALSVSQTQWYNNRLSIGVPRNSQSTAIAPEPQIAEPVPYSKYVVPTAVNRLPKVDPLAAVAFSSPDFALMDSITETFGANFSNALSSTRQDSGLTCMGFTERYERQAVTGGHPSTNAIKPDHLEALDPSRAPLKHLTGILSEYRDEGGTYLSLLIGLQDPPKRRKIIGCLSNEELVLHDPFTAAMGLSLLSRLGVL